MQREQNYWEGHPRAQAATDAIIGGVIGTVAGYAALAVVGVAAGEAAAEGDPQRGAGMALASLLLPLAGGITGAAIGAGRERKGFTERQRKKARTGAAVGSIIPFVGASAGTYFWTERA